jgi:hypothetical protein
MAAAEAQALLKLEPAALERLTARFWSKVDKAGPGGCWLWTAGKNRDGYGKFRVGTRHVLAHRFAYRILRGPIPDGLQLDHVCRNHACVNPDPDHLEPVVQRVNLLRGDGWAAQNARKTHCIRGHELSGANLRWERDRCGLKRTCLACKRQRERQRSARRKAAAARDDAREPAA